MTNLELGVIGNCAYGGLIDREGRLVWCCLPRFDADPIFCSLLKGDEAHAEGVYAIELIGLARSEQHYRHNTAVLVTRLYDDGGSGIEISDFAPRFTLYGRSFHPTTLVRRARPIGGEPRIRIKVRPRFEYGTKNPRITRGSNHIRYIGPNYTVRLTTDAPIAYLLAETPFVLEQPLSLLLGPDESLAGAAQDTAREFEERTVSYWRAWVRRLALPLEWQDAVIRAAITLKLCAFEETGAIIAAMTTSIPEAPNSGRNWDYRYCWLRDAFFVVRALNSLAEVETMEHYLRYLNNIVRGSQEGPGGHLQPVYGIGLETLLEEQIMEGLAGYRGMGPVRAGNQAYEHEQHDVYGNAILAASQAFFDHRLLRRPGPAEFQTLEAVAERAYAMHDQPDAGMWELRTRAHIHTSSSLMCWAACDRAAKIAREFALSERAALWRERAQTVKATIERRAFNETLGSYTDSFEGDRLDANLLLMAEVGFLDSADARFRATLKCVETELRRGNHLFRYTGADDFGLPENAFNICSFWYIDALARVGRHAEAREIFESMLACRNSFGLLSEDINTTTLELWGNYPQTYSLVGIINAATRLSRAWESEV